MESIYTLESFVNFTKIGLSPKSVKEYKGCVMHFLAFLEQKEKAPAELSKIDILEYVSILSNKELSASFIRTNYFAIKKYYKYLVKYDAFDRITFLDIFDDVDLPKVMHKNQKVYLKQDAEAILKVFAKGTHTYSGQTPTCEKNTGNPVSYGNYIFFLIITFTGARMAEVGQIKVEDIDFNTNHITFYPYRTQT